MQTQIKDMNGVDLNRGDLVNVFYTSSDGEHIHDCVYEVKTDWTGGLCLVFRYLLWEYHGYNQIPLSELLSATNGTFDSDHTQYDFTALMVKDTYGENHIFKNTWKQNDESRYFVKL
jgi:hypothetical protein